MNAIERVMQVHDASEHRRRPRRGRPGHRAPAALPPLNSAALLSLSVRSSFRAIARFLEGCRQSSASTRLAGLARAAGDLGRVSFELGIERSLIDGPIRADWLRCLEEIERLVRSLSAGASSPCWELAHALDTLIGLLVQLQGLPSTTPGRSTSEA